MTQVKAILGTGLTTCHDVLGKAVSCAGSGQDAEYHFGIVAVGDRFHSHGGVVHDGLTGLSWPGQADIFTYPLSWSETLDAVEELNKGVFLGYSDWRLPNRRELRSLISHGARKPALPGGHPFQNVFLGWYWTSTTAAKNSAYAWYIHMEGGRMFYGHKEQPAMGWPVRGESSVLPRTGQSACFDSSGHMMSCEGQRQDGALRMGLPWPRPRFKDHKIGVLDRLTGLVWARAADMGGLLDWQGALDGIARMNRDSGIKWRLPNINELESLVDASRADPALPEGHPFEMAGEAYWSSTTSFFEPDWAYALYLHKGAVGVGFKPKAEFFAWPVAGPL